MNRQAQRDLARKLKGGNHVIGLSSIYYCTSEALRNPSSPIEDRLSDFFPKRLVADPMLSFNIAGKGAFCSQFLAIQERLVGTKGLLLYLNANNSII